MFRVLIADDQRIVRQLLRIAVQSRDGLTVCAEEAETGRQAIDLAITHAPDAVILDCEMPEMDGMHALPAIRTALPHGLIVMYSANESPALPTAALQAGADTYVRKDDRTPAQVATLILEALTAAKA